jgi:hypothetical protein
VKLEVLRYSGGKETTLGLLFINGDFACYTLEDERRTVKMYGETAIPAGEYKVTLRTVGGKHQKYRGRFPYMHEGMLWVRDVPGFEYILIHVGNTDDDTEGCLLVGNSAVENVDGEGSIGSSVAAYKRIYPPIAAAIIQGEEVTIRYIDL